MRVLEVKNEEEMADERLKEDFTERLKMRVVVRTRHRNEDEADRLALNGNPNY